MLEESVGRAMHWGGEIILLEFNLPAMVTPKWLDIVVGILMNGNWSHTEWGMVNQPLHLFFYETSNNKHQEQLCKVLLVLILVGGLIVNHSSQLNLDHIKICCVVESCCLDDKIHLVDPPSCCILGWDWFHMGHLGRITILIWCVEVRYSSYFDYLNQQTDRALP